VSHFLSEKKSDHETLDKFLKKFNKKMDKFIEVWMGKHEKFDLGKNRQVNVYQITKDELFAYLDLVLQFLTGDSMNNSVYKLSKYTLGSVMNSKKNVDLMSIRDDIVRNINRMKYRLRLQ
jgi:aromatic ring-opening dioxygenase catalytic subunit (LigB family)